MNSVTTTSPGVTPLRDRQVEVELPGLEEQRRATRQPRRVEAEDRLAVPVRGEGDQEVGGDVERAARQTGNDRLERQGQRQSQPDAVRHPDEQAALDRGCAGHTYLPTRRGQCRRRGLQERHDAPGARAALAELLGPEIGAQADQSKGKRSGLADVEGELHVLHSPPPPGVGRVGGS
jgi:hypothetical protein